MTPDPVGVPTPVEDAVAIIGMSGRFPGGASVAAFWDNLCRGREAIARFSDAELEDTFPPELRSAPNFVRARSILDDVDQFDAGFFGMRAREAALTDPQHRVFLEIAWEALENAGYDPARCDGAIGVFAGCGMNGYLLNNVLPDRDALTGFTSSYQVGEYPTLLGASADFLATRTSYKLDLRGPSLTVQTACSTSLVAVAQACQSLLLYQSDMALAGGVSITLPQQRGYLYEAGGMVSADGQCRTFDAAADGTVFGSGAGVVLLKRLEDAVASGDHVYAIIRGSAVNNDGASKVGFTAPSVDGQANVIRSAQAAAGVAPWTVGYVECHGTATPLGDPIEVAALVRAFGPAPEGASCVLGSVKPNVGHLDVAAGVAGLIKAALCLHRGVIPPTLHFAQLNPAIDLRGSPFRVSAEPVFWPKGPSPRRAGVSALGVGGTNVHIVLEEAPAVPIASSVEMSACHSLLALSARSSAALAHRREDLARCIEADSEFDLPNAAYTLQVGRRAFGHRFAAVCRDRSDAVAALRAASRPGISAAEVPVAFMFPGQGSQHPGMAHDLYRGDGLFRRHLDECADLLTSIMGLDIRHLLFDETGRPASADALRSTDVTQPAIFCISYSLARTLSDRGIDPVSMIGHSVGELTAACLARVFSLEDALGIIVERGRLMRSLPGGGMLGVRLSERDLLPLLGPDLAVAAVNGPALCTVAGPDDALAALAADFEVRGVTCRALQSSHAFHSAAMDPILGHLEDVVRGVRLRAPASPYISGVTGTWITPGQATSPEYWARHCRETVRFADGLATLLADRDIALLEVGPGQALTAMACQGAARGSKLPVLPMMPHEASGVSDLTQFLGSIGRLWAAGADLDWEAWHRDAACRRIPLPTYPFERSRHWIDAPSRPALLNTQHEPDTVSMQTQVEAPIQHADNAGEEAPADLRLSKVAASILDLLRDLSGEDLPDCNLHASFLELGFDSLFLSQVAQRVQRLFGVTLTFRQLLATERTVALLAEFIVAEMPVEPASRPVLAQSTAPSDRSSAPVPAFSATASASAMIGTAPTMPVVQAIMREQTVAMSELFSRQLSALQSFGGVSDVAADVPLVASVPVPARLPAAPLVALVPVAIDADAVRLEAFRPVRVLEGDGLDPMQRRHIADLVTAYVARTPGSKKATQRHRAVMADPRVAASFRSNWKEMVYPITTTRSAGALVWDVDGNEYIDILNGFGQTAFGHSADFVVEAVAAQLAKGFEIGPQTPLAGEVAELVRELTGNERVAFCNTGSEAVMAAMRVARAVTGRDRVVFFSGAYHGQFDEVLMKAMRRGGVQGAIPAASGIPTHSAGSVTVLEYAATESVTWILENAHEIAAVIVEPVQSRRPGLQPREFLAELRNATSSAGIALVFDEVVTGFRTHPGGMQALFDIRADMVTYGKVVGGGLPIGLLAGKSRFMNALDGGSWSYGDASQPEADVTFFAGTFVRHPLALAAARAVLSHVKREGPSLQEKLTQQTAALVAALNRVLESRGLRSRIESFSSFFYLNLSPEEPNASLIYYHLRMRGIHIQEGFPCFLTTSHGKTEVDRVVAAFAESIDAMRGGGFFKSTACIAAPLRTSEAALCPVMAPIEAEPVLTPSQMEIWLACQIGDAASCAFNESVSLRLEGVLDVACLEGALGDVVARHDALRLRFSPIGDFMRAAPPGPEVLDIVHFEDEAEFMGFVEREVTTPFDLVAGPVVRHTLVCLPERTQILVLTAHHIVCDGWSMNILLDELSKCYTARVTGVSVTLPPAPGFLAHALAREMEPSIGERDRLHWVAQFASTMPSLRLPLDRPPVAIRTFRGGTETALVDLTLLRSLRHAGATRNCTLFTTLLAAFATLVGRLGGQSDVVVGVPMAGQTLLQDQAMVGHCVNMLPLRMSWNDDTSLTGLMASTSQAVLQAREHQDCTLGTIVRSLNLIRGLGGTPLTSVQFNLERLGVDLEMPKVVAVVSPNPKRFVQFELFLNVTEGDQGLRIDCDYDADLFNASTIRRWLGHYKRVLEAFASNPDALVSRVPLISAVDQARMLRSSVGTHAGLHPIATVHTLFERQAARRPEATAILFGGVATSYGELDRRANQIANLLRRRIGPIEARVGIAVERSADMVASLLAVLKAGYAYVPLDPHHPVARQARILSDSGAAVVVCDDAWDGLETRAEWSTVQLGADEVSIASEAPLPPSCPAEDASDLAYIIYTSGSTGLPKGVEVTHGSLVNFLRSMCAAPGIVEGDILCAVTTVAFDIAAMELFLPLVVGATVALASRTDVVDGIALRALMFESNATTVQATPATWHLLLEAGFESHPGFKMLCGGEKWSRGLADELLRGGGELWNMYGPTETTIWSSTVRVLPGTAPITIGEPIAGTRFFILDQHGQLSPVGVPGELHIAGTGLARGYHGDPERTAARFVPEPFSGGAGRMFRTGDAALLTPEGEVLLLGRLDLQIKLRGFRIEIEEVEAALTKYAGLAAAAVALRVDVPEHPNLVCYYVEPDGISRDAGQLRETLRQLLPDYMIPSAWVRLPALPVSLNGKLDRSALPDPRQVADAPSAHKPPCTPVEVALCRIWSEVLGGRMVGLDDDILDLGADSIQLFQIVARANHEQIRVTARQLVEHRTVGVLAAFASAAGLEDHHDSPGLTSLRNAASLRHLRPLMPSATPQTREPRP